MRFNLNQEHVDNLKEYFIKILKRDLKYNEFWALKDVNLIKNKYIWFNYCCNRKTKP